MKFTEDQISLLRQAMEKWGENAQCAMVQEECLELSIAMHKFLNRYKSDNHDKHITDVVDEIADVTIMMEQAKILFSEEMIKDRINFKMDRLEKRLKK